MKSRKKQSKIFKPYKGKNGIVMLLSKCAVCDSKNSKFIKEQEAGRLLSSLGKNTPLSKIPSVRRLLF